MGDQHSGLFDSPEMIADTGRLHPFYTFMLMSLTTNGALLVFLHALTTRFTVLTGILIFFLVLSSVSLYRTA